MLLRVHSFANAEDNKAPAITAAGPWNVPREDFVVVGEAPTMEALLVRRDAEQRFSSEILFETVVPALAHARRPSAFQF